MSSNFNFKRCQSCRTLLPNGQQFVHDVRSNDWICTLCGAVVSRYMYGDQEHTYSDTVPVDSSLSTSATRLEARGHQRLMDRAFPASKRLDTLYAQLGTLATQLDCSDGVLSRAKVMIEKFPDLLKVRPHNHMLMAVLIVAKRSYGHYVNVKHVSTLLNVDDLGKTVITTCTIMGLSQRSTPESHIPYFTALMGFRYRFNRFIKKLYLQARRKNGSIGSDTLLALVLYKFFMANRTKTTVDCTIEFIAKITHTSLSSLKGYVDGTGGKCTLFNKND